MTVVEMEEKIKELYAKIKQLNKDILPLKNEIETFKKEINDIRKTCRHKNKNVVKYVMRYPKVYCSDCGKLLGYKCGKRDKSPCSYDKYDKDIYHTPCRHGCGRIREDDCQ